MFDDDYEKKKHKLIFEKVSKAIREDPENWESQLEQLGFTWFDDEDDQEEIEENAATADSIDQEFLVAYFEGHVKLTNEVLDAYQREKNSASPNYPLIRRYFRKGNENLKTLILFGIQKNPTDLDLISDLGFFHEYSNILTELIQVYLKACTEETDLGEFERLALNFSYDTEPDGFDALHELRQRFEPGSAKGKVIKRILQEQISEPACVEF
jgi:hypothetical protein